MTTHFDAEIRAALLQRKGDWRAVAASSGISYSWISKFVNRKIPNPGYETLKKLAAVLRVGGSSRARKAAAPAAAVEA